MECIFVSFFFLLVLISTNGLANQRDTNSMGRSYSEALGILEHWSDKEVLENFELRKKVLLDRAAMGDTAAAADVLHLQRAYDNLKSEELRLDYFNENKVIPEAGNLIVDQGKNKPLVESTIGKKDATKKNVALEVSKDTQKEAHSSNEKTESGRSSKTSVQALQRPLTGLFPEAPIKVESPSEYGQDNGTPETLKDDKSSLPSVAPPEQTMPDRDRNNEENEKTNHFPLKTPKTEAISIEEVAVKLMTSDPPMRFVISRKENDEVTVHINSSTKIHRLSPAQQAATTFTLSGQTKEDALAILSNEAILAEDKSIRPPEQANIVLQILFKHKGKHDVHYVLDPLVILKGRFSNVLGDLARRAIESYNKLQDKSGLSSEQYQELLNKESNRRCRAMLRKASGIKVAHQPSETSK